MERVTVIVDGANVMGARADGWWRDRAAAMARLHGQLAGLADRGLTRQASDAAEVPQGSDPPEVPQGGGMPGVAPGGGAMEVPPGGGMPGVAPGGGAMEVPQGGGMPGVAPGGGAMEVPQGGGMPGVAQGSDPPEVPQGGGMPGVAPGSDVPEARAGVGGRWYPEFVLVVEGKAKAAVPTLGQTSRVRIMAAPGSGDDAIADLAASLPGRRLVVTADRELRRRSMAAGAAVVGPRWLLDLL